MNVTFNGIDISAHYDFPMEIYFCIVYTSQGASETVMPRYPFRNGWGCSNVETCRVNQTNNEYVRLKIAWLSLSEHKFFLCDDQLTSLRSNYCDQKFDKLLVGLATNGNIVLWGKSEDKSIILTKLKGQEIEMTLEEFLGFSSTYSIEEYCRLRMGASNERSNSIDFFKILMRQYNFKFKIISEDVLAQNENITSMLRILSFDGCYDKTNSCQMKNFGMRGVPTIISLKYDLNKAERLITFFLNEDILLFFTHFYGAHPETKTDFIIRIDAENKKYELALYRQGLKEPVVIPESAYQLIVFKNKFEDYRSENYNQPRGAWIW